MSTMNSSASSEVECKSTQEDARKFEVVCEKGRQAENAKEMMFRSGKTLLRYLVVDDSIATPLSQTTEKWQPKTVNTGDNDKSRLAGMTVGSGLACCADIAVDITIIGGNLTAAPILVASTSLTVPELDGLVIAYRNTEDKAKTCQLEDQFLKGLQSKGCCIVVFGDDLVKSINQIIAALKKLGLGKEKTMYVLMKFITSSYSDTLTEVEEKQQLKLILLEQRLLSSPAGSSQQSRILRELTTEFVTTLEGQLQRGLVPHSDAKIVTLLPFRADMKDYIPNMSFFALQVSFPVSILKKKMALLLLASRVLYSSLEDILLEVQCEDQAMVIQKSSAFMVTENHAIEALIQFSQLQNVFWYIVSYNSEKCSVEMMGKVQDKLQQNFKSEFSSREFSIEPLNTPQQQPLYDFAGQKELQQIKTAVEESKPNSGQTNEQYVITNSKFVE